MLYTYQAVFTQESEGYSVELPDFGCATQGDDLKEALQMAEELLACRIYDFKREKRDIPEPSIYDGELTKGQFVSNISVDAEKYAKKHFEKSVKKTVSIPFWLNQEATAKGLNFSLILRNALIKELKA